MSNLPKYPSKVRVCHCHADDSDPLVKNDLAITPGKMFEMVQRGQPISEQVMVLDSDFVEGYNKLDFEPPHIYTRHADIISAWNVQRDNKNAFLNILSNDKQESA